MKEFSVKLTNVSVHYRIAREKRRTVQEFLIHLAKGKKIEYEDFVALKKTTLEVPAGETLGIIGHNGAGKSTLLKVIARVIIPKGEVCVKGTVAPLIELGAGFDPELTGKENIYLNASILGFSRKEIDKRFDKIVEFSELGEFIYSPLRNYSSGMVSRLGFSVATEVNTEILVIDEILSVGDEHFRKKCDKRILNFKKRGTTMLLVSHDMDEIRRLCDRVLWLDHGKVKMLGDPETVVKAYKAA